MVNGALGNAGHAVVGSGGGGDGTYVFADLTELDHIIAALSSIREAVESDRDALRNAQLTVRPPAADEMSKRQSRALLDSLTAARSHNEAMWRYVDAYIEKLASARHRYASDDHVVTTRLRGIHAS